MRTADDPDAVAALCATARARLPAPGFHRLRVLLDMLLIDLKRGQPGETARADASPAVEPDKHRLDRS